MLNQQTALLFSGGLDSILAFYVLNKPRVIYCGGPRGPNTHSNMGELQAITTMQQLVPELRSRFLGIIADFTPFMRKDRWIFPRDQVCAMLAWAQGYNKVLLAWTRNDGEDAEFIQSKKRSIEGCIDCDKFECGFPVAHTSKAELMMQALALGAPPEVLQVSHSCNAMNDRHCGNCENCCERFIAFKVAGVPEDPDTYITSPQKSGAMKELLAKHAGKKWFENQAKVALGIEAYHANCV